MNGMSETILKYWNKLKENDWLYIPSLFMIIFLLSLATGLTISFLVGS
jgi:hypothetical protein